MRRTLLVLAVTAACAACSTTTTATRQVTVSTEALPAGALQSLVVQPGEVPDGQVPLLKATGPADLAKIASFSSSPAAMQASLARNGFTDAYVVEYADLDRQTSLVVTVVRFATAAGADAQVAADLGAAPAAGSRPVPVSPVIGDRSGEIAGPQPGTTGQLVTLRFRVGRLAYLVAAAGPKTVDPAGVASVARTLATRAASSPLSR